ncbi:MAG: Aminotransferase class [Pedosphaera sp.]|nr:Aminotransferase class [Pedosphaera sp.]
MKSIPDKQSFSPLKHFLRALYSWVPYINPVMIESPELQQVDRTYVQYKGRKLIYFAGCDYFRMASHPEVLKAVKDGLDQYGLNVAASRLTTGNHKLYGLLEGSLANFFGAESALLASNGYAPNLMVAQALAGQFSHALIDERAHCALVDAAQLLDCPIIKFKHRSPDDLGQILKRLGKIKPLFMTDGMFSHDGSIAPLQEYVHLLPAQGLILLDDAHGAGILGKTGRGTPEHAGVPRKQIIQTITLSKAFGVYGGAVLGSNSLKKSIVAKSRLFVGNTPLPLPLANAAIQSIRILKADKNLRKRLIQNTNTFKVALNNGGFEIQNNSSPVVPIIPQNAKQTARLNQQLLTSGIYPPFIKYPGGPQSGYFRFVFSSEHTQEQLNLLLKALLV